jgi:hypothetical protein
MKLFANQAHPRVNLAVALMHRVGDLGLDLTGITGLNHLLTAHYARFKSTDCLA